MKVDRYFYGSMNEGQCLGNPRKDMSEDQVPVQNTQAPAVAPVKKPDAVAGQAPVTNPPAAPAAPVQGQAPVQAKAPVQGQAPAAAPQAQAAAPAPAPNAPAKTQQAVNTMSVTSQNPVDLAPGVRLGAGSKATISPGDLSGNVTVDVGGKKYSVPDANLKTLIQQGGLQVSQIEGVERVALLANYLLS